jgi:hypothetical protein
MGKQDAGGGAACTMFTLVLEKIPIMCCSRTTYVVLGQEAVTELETII